MEIFTERHLYFAGLVVLLALGVTLLLSGSKGPLAKIPGPWYTKWTALVTKYKTLAGQKPAWVHSLHLQYGPVVRISPHEVDVADAAAAQQIHRVKQEFLKAPMYTNLVPGASNVFNTTDVDIHRRHRKLLSSPLSESGLKTFLPQIDAKVRLAVQRIDEEGKARGAADVLKWCLFMATDVIGELSFGESFRMLEYGQKNQYIKDLESVAPFAALRATFPILTRLSLASVPIPIFNKAAAITKRIRKYALESIQRHKDLVENESEDVRPTLLSKLYKAGDDETMTQLEIRDNAQAYIVAGSDTTAHTLTYLIWSVCRHPKVREKLVRELDSLDDDFTVHDLKDLAYLQQVVTETLRLYSAVPAGLPRLVPQGGAELAGYWIPEGYTVLTQAYSLHRHSQVFPEPETFDPARWEKPTKQMRDSFMPFGGGSRICIGLHLARIELQLATARFFRAFPNAKVSDEEGMSDADMDPALYFLMVPKGHRCLIQTS